jgi:anti-anti-sigma factor
MSRDDALSATYRLVHPKTGYVVVELLGEHDLDGRDHRTDLLRDLIATHDVVVVDVTEADFIDSSVLTNLVMADRFARQEGKSFRVQVGTSPIVRKALDISHVLDGLKWAHTREDVLADDVRVGGPDRATKSA